MHITLHARTNPSRRGRCDSQATADARGFREAGDTCTVIYIREAKPLSISSAREDYHTVPFHLRSGIFYSGSYSQIRLDSEPRQDDDSESRFVISNLDYGHWSVSAMISKGGVS